MPIRKIHRASVVVAAIFAAAAVSGFGCGSADRAMSTPSDDVATTRPADPRTTEVMAHQPAVLLGTGSDQLIGYTLPASIARFDEASPTLRLPAGIGDVNALRVTRLRYCPHDRPGRGLPRKVDLWLPTPETSVQAIPIESSAADGSSAVRPARPLAEGAYCLYLDGPAAASKAPTYSAVFLIRGYERPSVAAKQVTVTARGITLDVDVRNEGGGAFDDGRLFVTLQRLGGGRPVFAGRWEEAIPTVHARGQRRVTVAAGRPKEGPGDYYFYGWIGYPTAMDSALALEEFKSDPFTLPGDAAAAAP